MARLLGPAMAYVIEEVLKYLEERLLFIRVYASALQPGIPPTKLPKFVFKVRLRGLQSPCSTSEEAGATLADWWRVRGLRDSAEATAGVRGP
jgi:hypothetical protein